MDARADETRKTTEETMNEIPNTVLIDLARQSSELADQYAQAEGVLPPRKASERLSLALSEALEAAYLRGVSDAERK